MLKWLFGDKPIQSVIERDQSAQGTLIWMHPETEFNTNSRLNLGPNEIAIFYDLYKNEIKILDRSQDLTTGNIPLLERFSTSITGGVSKYQCRVYFVNTTVGVNIEWGAANLGPIFDHLRKLYFTIGMSGYCTFEVKDPLKLARLIDGDKVSTFQSFMTERALHPIKAFLFKEVDMISTSLNLDFFVYKHFFMRCVDGLKDDMQREVFDEFGLKIKKMELEAIEYDDDYASALKALNKDATQAASIDALGLQKYLLIHGVNIAELAASNNGAAGAMAGVGIGAGVGCSVGSSLGEMIQSTLGSMVPDNAATLMPGTNPMPAGQPVADQAPFGNPMPGVAPVGQAPVGQPTISTEDAIRLEKLKHLHERHLLSDDLYSVEVQKILSKL